MHRAGLSDHLQRLQPRHQPEQVLQRYAKRYAWLRERNLNTVHEGGIFAGKTPMNVVLNGTDLDDEIDAAMLPAA